VNVVASLPLLFLYPVLLSAATYSLNHSAHRQSRELERQNAIDAFTGLSNRTSWEEKVDRELYRASHFGHSASLLMIDIDHFKTINDRYGHPAGDAVIAAVAETIKACIRDIDHAGRYGGDEFCVLLTHTGEHAATVVAERIRSRVNEARLAEAPDLVCTLSIGVAAAGRGMRTRVDWVERADTALYRAKALGRNRTVRVGDSPGGDTRSLQTFTES
jgi:diguanylate cyclase